MPPAKLEKNLGKVGIGDSLPADTTRPTNADDETLLASPEALFWCADKRRIDNLERICVLHTILTRISHVLRLGKAKGEFHKSARIALRLTRSRPNNSAIKGGIIQSNPTGCQA